MEIGFLNFYSGVLGASQDRAALIANNIANADTPGFKAKDIDFATARRLFTLVCVLHQRIV